MLFSAPMVKAQLAKRKHQTRRVISPLPGHEATFDPKYELGDRIWVKETWRTYVSLDAVKPSEIWGPEQNRGAAIFYEAGGNMTISRDSPRVRSFGPTPEVLTAKAGALGKVRVSIHMPRWASRLTLKITDVRVQRLNDISTDDAMQEGIVLDVKRGYEVPGLAHPNKDFPYLSRPTAVEMYAALMDVLHGSGFWLSNPWVVALTFEEVAP